MITITVGPAFGGGWDVLYDYGVQGHTEHFKFKLFAVLSARRAAKEDATHGRAVSLKIKDKRGRYQEERTYPRSADPERFKG